MSSVKSTIEAATRMARNDPRSPAMYFEQVTPRPIARTNTNAWQTLNNMRASQWSRTQYIQTNVRNTINLRKNRVIRARRDDTEMITNPELKRQLSKYGAYGKGAGVIIASTPRIQHFNNNLDLNVPGEAQ